MSYSTIEKLVQSGSLSASRGTILTVPENSGSAEYILVNDDLSNHKALLMRRYLLPDQVAYSIKPTAGAPISGYLGHNLDWAISGESEDGNHKDDIVPFINRFSSNGMSRILVGNSIISKDADGSWTVNKKAFAPSISELGQTGENADEGNPFSYFVSSPNSKRVATLKGSATPQKYFTRTNKRRNVWPGEYYVDTDGSINWDSNQAWKYYIRPVICVDTRTTVEVNGGNYTVIPNLPTSSSNITGTVPSLVNNDTIFSITWSSASDSDTSASNITYRLERSYGSNQWEVVGTYKGRNTATDTIPYNRNNSTVTYRITAYDNYDNGDGVYKTLGTASIHNNAAPRLIGKLNVQGIYKNSTLAISWSRAVDSDNNVSYYKLYRNVDGGSKTFVSDIYDPVSRFEDTSGDWDTVIYSLKAVDTDGVESNEIVSALITLVEENTMTLEFTGSTSPNHIQDTDSGQDMTDDEATAVFTLTDPDNEDKSYSYTLLLDGSVLVSGGITHRNIEIATAFVDDSVVISPKIFKPEWQKLRNGNHTLQMTVADSNGMTRTVSKTFVKQCNTVTYVTDTYGLASGATDVPESFTLNITGNFPTNAIYEVKVCRNANASTPTETTLNQSEINKINSNESIEFSDAAPALNEFGFYVKATLKRPVGDTFEGAYYVTSISGMIGENIFVYLQSQIDDLKNRMQ